MPSKLIRRGVLGAGLVAVAVVAILAALPLIASNRIVRDRIAQELSAWSGYEVTIAGDPEIEVWPDLRAILNDVSMREPGSSNGPAIKADRLEIELSALSALTGDVVFSNASLVRPTLVVTGGEDGALMVPMPAGGRISKAIDVARSAIRDNPVAPDQGRLAADAFGSVEIADGRIVVERSGAQEEMVSSVSGRIEWPALNSDGRLSLTGTWRNERVDLSITALRPMLIFAGGSTPVTASLKSAKAELAFEGTAGLLGNAFVDGKASFSATSLRSALEWMYATPAPGATSGQASVSGGVIASKQRVKLERADMTLAGNIGHGAIEIGLTGAVPMVSGTLAFETLDLSSFLSALTPQEPGIGALGSDLFDRVSLDVRLSASQAKSGTFSLSDLAATARISAGVAAFDISDASAFGGSIQAGLRIDRRSDEPTAEVRLLASDVEGGAFGTAMGMSRMVPIGTGTVSVILKGPGEAWTSLIERADGSVSARFGPGALSGFDLDAFLARTAKGGFFSLQEVSDGNFPVDGVELRASMTDGVATLEKAEAWSSTHRIKLTGLVPYLGRGLALSGLVLPSHNTAEGSEQPSASFFVGGSWAEPFVSPTPSGPPR